MNIPYTRAPHQEGASAPGVSPGAPNAALLIDFDNVTMGMRSDLSKELKNLMGSDIIKGKVTVQRAYADWRRYPQYIVPLSEASIDLIFAPAYGSSKKNATDIRMAIDGMELVFIRPEIGTYILLTGDSDFSSLVLKLKEYGKYVIGVGIQESSSDILVQNCDEYYSYTSLTGLRKTGKDDTSAMDPWVLVEKALEQMKRRGDVMRSDRLKQVMLEIDGGFDEKALGFSKFSRFITEAAKKNLMQIRKLENGQYELTPSGSGGGRSGSSSRDDRSSRGSRNGSSGGRSSRRDSSRSTSSRSDSSRSESAPSDSGEGTDGQDLTTAYDLMLRAIDDLLEDSGDASVRDSDVKRRMLVLDDGFDEAEYGFSKFSRFLAKATDDGVIQLDTSENGNYQVSRGSKAAPAAPSSKADEPAAPDRSSEPSREPKASKAETAPPSRTPDSSSRRLRPRQSKGRKATDGPPPLLEGQMVGATSTSGKDDGSKDAEGKKGAPASKKAPSRRATSKKSAEKKPTQKKGRSGRGKSAAKPSAPGLLDLEVLGLPTDRDSVVQYLSNSWKGVGKKTAESLVDEVGTNVFEVIHTDPDRVREVLTPARAEKVIEGWTTDYDRRTSE